MIKAILFLFLLSSWQQWTPTEGAANPGLQLAITSKGLEYVADVGIPMLTKELETIVIPEFSGKHHDIHYEFKNIKIESISMPTYSLTSGSSGLELKITDISASIHGDWHYRLHVISDSGSADLLLSSSSINISIILGRDSLNHMTLEQPKCSDDIGHLTVKLHGGAHWLYDIFHDTIRDHVKDFLSKSLCSTAVKYINTSGNAAVESIPFVSKLDSIAEINYKLFSAPLFKTTYFQTQHTGEVYSIAKPVEAPCIAPVIPAASTVDGSKMLYLWVSTYVPNTAAFVYQEAGILTHTVTPNTTLPGGIPLTTDYFGRFIPQLSAKYPHRPMQFEISAGKYPNTSVSDNTITLDVPGTLVAMVQLPNSSFIPVFTLGLFIKTTAEVLLTQKDGSEIIGFKDKLLSIDMKVLSSEIGSFNVTNLEQAVNLFANYTVVHAINTAGIPIPIVDGISFVDASVSLGANYIVVATDIIYKPTMFV